MKATGEQIQAIRTQDRALVVEAGAGTGKTWVLVERFMHLLEEHADWPVDSLIAVTFTEKATREMRSRIRQAVEARAAPAPPGSPWRERRRQLERLQVNTIHGLCARILRENAIAAGIDPYFEVLEEQDADLLKEEAIQNTIGELVEEDSPALDLLVSISGRDLKDEMSSLIARRASVQRLFRTLPGAEALLAGWKENVQAMRETQWQEQLRQNPEFRAALDDLAGVDILDPEDKLAPGVAAAQNGIALAKAGDHLGAVEAWLPIGLKGGRKDNWGGEELLAGLKEQLGTLRGVAQDLEKSGFTERFGAADEAAALALQLWKALWERLDDNYNRLKDAGQFLDFDDLELHAADLLRPESQDERLAAFLAGINHLMVDEFQDTNAVQRDIVYALADPQDGGRLFVVGDAKQSIYRFRQAQVSVFNQTIQDVRAATGCDPVPLSRSFRTHSRLVEALNHLFDRVLQPLQEKPAGFEAQPAPLTAHRPSPPASASAPAPVELVLVPGQDGQDESLSAEDGRIFEAQFLAERILALQGQGYRVWDKKEQGYRPFRFSDAAILFRATTSLPLYEEAFKQAGLPYLTVSGRGYYDRPEVQDLIALLASLQDPGDDLNLAAALRSPLFNLSDETLYRLRWHTPSGRLAEKPVCFRQALSDPPATAQPDQVAFAAEVLDDLWRKAGRVEVWRLLRSALDRTGFEAALALDGANPNGGSRQLGNVGKFLQLARQRGGTSLSGFLRRLNDLRAREAREGEALGSAPDSGAVQLMSIHAAKGLEFPVVAVADLGRSQRGAFGSPRILHDPAFGFVCKQRDRDGDWHKPASYRWGEWLNERMEAAEDRRLLYVACTRAADLLILSGKVSRGTSWLKDILEIWPVPEDGPAEEVLAIAGFSLRVLRPQYQLAEAIPGPRQFRQSAGLDEVPPLARPLPEVSRPQAMAVTGYARAQSADDDIPPLRPIFKPDDSAGKKTFVPGYIVGDIVHRALAGWEPLALPNPQLRERIAAYARREGLTGDGAVQFAVERAMRMLANLRRSDLYEQINHAARRLTEVPFSLSSQAGDFHGVIDMLYQDGRGGWHLIDWKTEWVSGEKLEEQAHRHLAQLSVYSQAIVHSLHCSPTVSICFLHPDFCNYTFSEAQIEATSASLEPLLP